jgi:hypothetical protein
MLGDTPKPPGPPGPPILGGEREQGGHPGPPAGGRPGTGGEGAGDTAAPPVGGVGLALRVGEIVEASSCDLVAQSVRLHEAPAFGSLVRVPVAAVEQRPATLVGGVLAHDLSDARRPLPGMGGHGEPTELYAIVAETRTASLEAGGRPIARGHEDVVDAAIYRENPDLEHVLRTEFKALLVGFRAGGALRQHLPPLPPPLHYSVYACTAPEVVAFTERLDFLRTLLAAPPGLADELAAASVRAAAAARGGTAGEAFLLRVGRELAVLLRDDYDRLTAVLRRLRPAEARG